MEPGEILSRLADLGRHIALGAALAGIRWRSRRLAGQSNGRNGFPELYAAIHGIAPEGRNGVTAKADYWLHHRASLFALHDISLGETIEWQRDYSSTITAPMRYSGLINHRDVAVVGNVKYVWELNRLQHLVLLGLAALWTGRTAYREEIARQTRSWQQQNPFMKGLNWKSPLEAGLRLISWAFVSALLQGASRPGDVFDAAVCETVYQHQYFIRAFHSKYSSANNHLIGEMAGLYVGSTFWPWYRESSSWHKFARRKLTHEICRQVESDGVGKERAIEYQLFILEFFLLTGALGEAIGEPFPQEYWERLRRMVAFIAAISDRSGNLPMFGDSDSGQVVGLPETTRERARALVRLGHPVDGVATGLDLRTVLLLWGQASTKLLLASGSAADQDLQTFPQGGYYVLAIDRGRIDEMLVVFDAGPLGLSPLYAHGHADALSFWLSYGGHEFLIDPGTFCYHASASWRSYFRGTAAHNTIRVDGEDQSVAAGPFLWRHVAHCKAEHMQDTDESIEVAGFHDGYQRLADPVMHRRSLRLYKRSRTLLITDRLECCRSHDVELLFHFSEQCAVRQIGPHAFQISNDNRHLCLRLDPRLKPALYQGSEQPIFGWVSRTFDVKESSFTLVAKARITGHTLFLTEINPL
jgi:uncharacterized heparinase superfamily protein